MLEQNESRRPSQSDSSDSESIILGPDGLEQWSDDDTDSGNEDGFIVYTDESDNGSESRSSSWSSQKSGSEFSSDETDWASSDETSCETSAIHCEPGLQEDSASAIPDEEVEDDCEGLSLSNILPLHTKRSRRATCHFSFDDLHDPDWAREHYTIYTDEEELGDTN